MTQPAISTNQVTKSFPDKNNPSQTTTALNNINLEINQGELFGLIGPNGAGKSTLISILTTIVKKDSGNIHIFEHNLDKNPREAKQLIGIMPQEINLHPFETPIKIIIKQAGYYGIKKIDALPWAEELLHILELWHKRNQQVRTLSGGMKRRLMIARALINKPKILFLDEPTTGVDVELRSKIWKFIKQINQQGTTIVLTTHYLEEAENLCDRIAVINHGNIIETTKTQDMINNRSSESFILDVNNKPTEIPKNLPFKMEANNKHSLRVTLTQQQTLNQVFTELAKHKITVSSMRNETNRLEQHIKQLLQGE